MINMRINPILNTDSYKASHFLQYPPDTEGYFGYVEARKPLKCVESIGETVFFGLQMFIKEYLLNPITKEDIDESEMFFKVHGEPFDREGWEYILKKYDGYFPVTIKAVKEGMVIPEGNVLCTVECVDKKVFWIGSYLETALLRSIWYPSTVATNSRECKKVIWKYMKLSSDFPEEGMHFKLHDFGARGVSSNESAGIGGSAHLINFMGSDTIEGVLYTNKYYNCDMAGFSIPAAEHSTITAWGKDKEHLAYNNMLMKFGGKDKIFACVSDSYDIFNACENLWGGILNKDVRLSEGIVVVRPDSGDPSTTVTKCLHILDDKFGNVMNNKGFKILNNVRVIQGDGININSIRDICKMVTKHGFSLDNVNFGMGGALLQHLNRDTLRFAMKCSAIKVNDKWKDVFKSPVGDPMKNSKAGRISTFINKIKNEHDIFTSFYTQRLDEKPIGEDILEIVYQNGKLLRDQTFDEVRKLASL